MRATILVLFTLVSLITFGPREAKAGSKATLALSPAAAGVTVTFQDGLNGYNGETDTYLDKYDNRDGTGAGNTVEGHQTWLDIRWYPSDGSQEDMLALIQFDLSSIPTTATVTSAELQLHSLRANVNATAVPTLSQVTSSWTPLWTWDMGVPTTVATSITCPSAASLTLSPTTPQSYVIPGMESLIQTWVSNPASNMGLMLSTATDLELRFCSSRYSPTQYCPALSVTYTTGGPPPTITVNTPPPTATSSPLTVTGTAAASGSATVSQVTWKNTTSGATGTASGTTSWTASVLLADGSNSITFTVTDSLGDTTTATITVDLLGGPASAGGGGGSGNGSHGLKCGATGLESLLALALLSLRRRVRRRCATLRREIPLSSP